MGHGLLGGADGAQHLVLHLDHPLGLLQDLLALGHDETDGVPQVVGGAAHGDHGVPVLHQVAHLVLSRDVGGGEHPRHPGQGLGLLGVDGPDNGPGVGGADRRGVEHAVHVDVVGVEALAPDLLRRVYPVDPGPQGPGAGLLRQSALAEDGRRQAYARNDLHIAGAAADVGAQGAADLPLRGVRILVQQALGGHHHPRDAEAALDRPRLPKAAGVGLLFKFAEPLHGEERFALQLVRGEDAGPGGLSVHQDGAGAAGPLAAPVLHGGQAQLVPQEADQLLIVIGSYGLAVDCKCGHVVSPFRSPGRIYGICSYYNGCSGYIQQDFSSFPAERRGERREGTGW